MLLCIFLNGLYRFSCTRVHMASFMHDFFFYIQNITCFGLLVMCTGTYRSLFCLEEKGKYKVVLSVNTVVGGQVSGIQ